MRFQVLLAAALPTAVCFTVSDMVAVVHRCIGLWLRQGTLCQAAYRPFLRSVFWGGKKRVDVYTHVTHLLSVQVLLL